MTAITQDRPAGSFILTMANGHLSMENGTAGGTLAAGELVKSSGGNLVSYDGSGTVIGIALRAAVSGDKIAYVARDAEVNGNLITSTEDTDGIVEALGLAGLATLGIIVRS